MLNVNVLTLENNGSKVKLYDPCREDTFVDVPSALLGTKKTICEITVDSGVFCAALKRVAVAASDDDARPVLTGVLFEIEPNFGTINLAAADGFRLATDFVAASIQIADEDILPANTRINVPARFLQKVIALSKKGALTISVVGGDPEAVIGRRWVSFLLPGGEIELTSMVIEGKFPDYQAIIPKDKGANIFSFQGADMRRALARIAALEYWGRVTVGTTVLSEKKLALRSHVEEPDESSFEEVIAITPVQGEDHKTAFNYRFLAEGMADSGEITFSQQIATLPIKLTYANLPNYTYVLMPMHAGD